MRSACCMLRAMTPAEPDSKNVMGSDSNRAKVARTSRKSMRCVASISRYWRKKVNAPSNKMASTTPATSANSVEPVSWGTTRSITSCKKIGIASASTCSKRAASAMSRKFLRSSHSCGMNQRSPNGCDSSMAE